MENINNINNDINKKSKASLIWGILSIVFGCFGLIFGIIAIVLGNSAKKLNPNSGSGGIVTGIIGIIMNVVVIPIVLIICIPVLIGHNIKTELENANRNAEIVFAEAQRICDAEAEKGGNITATIVFDDDPHNENFNYGNESESMTQGEFELAMRQNCNFENIKPDDYDDIKWMVYIEGNKVVSAIFAEDDDFVGGYPIPQSVDEVTNNQQRWFFDENSLQYKALSQRIYQSDNTSDDQNIEEFPIR